MNNKYPPLPEPLYERGDAPSMGAVSTDCYSADQMHAYADTAREGWLSPEDVKRLRGVLEALADYVDERADDNECRPLENARTALAATKTGETNG